ncbi:MAG: hypothetical protein ACQESC_01865 [Nanobdellota archaeon]
MTKKGESIISFQKKHATLLYALLFLLLVGTAQANIDFDGVDFEEITNPRPTFNIEFDNSDAPVNITSHSLVNEYGYSVPTIITSDDEQQEFTVSLDVQGSLFGRYVLQLIAKDVDGNIKRKYKGIDVIPLPMNIWVENPTNDFIESSSTNETLLAVGNTLPFNLTLRSETVSLCRLVKRNEITETFTLEQLYNQGKQFNDNNQSLTKQHTIPILSQDASDKTVLEGEFFDYSSYQTSNAYMIICRQGLVGSSSNYEYRQKELYLGYDLSPPDFTLNTTPQTVFDEANLKTTTRVNTETDKVLCSYNMTQNTNPFITPTTKLFTYPIQSISDYTRNTSYLFDLTSQIDLYDYTSSYPYEFDVTCTNPAGLSTTQHSSFEVQLQSTFDILYKDSGYYDTQNPELHFQTEKQAVCEYRFDSEELLDSETGENQKSHTIHLQSLEEGNYTITLRCEGVADITRNNFDFTIDLTPPEQPTTISSQHNCKPYWELILDEPSEEVIYNITLDDDASDNSTLFETTTEYTDSMEVITAPQTVDMEANMTLTWTVIAKDRSGQQSSPLSFTMTARDPSDLRCDRTPPQSSLSYEPTTDGFLVDVTCEDTESGCEETYLTTQQQLGTNCSQAPYSTPQSYNESLFVPAQTLLCYQVSDVAGNTVNASQMFTSDINITVQQPSNGLATTTSFSLEASTNRKAVCKHGPADITGNSTEQQFEQLTTLSATPSTAHKKTVVTSDYDIFDSESGDQTHPWIIICQENNDTYHEKTFDLGYDTTPAVLDIHADPNPITSPTSQATTLHVNTDDPTICTYLDTQGTSRGFSNYNPSDITSFTTRHQTTIDYWGWTRDSFKQNIVCRNKAGKVSSKEYDIDFSLVDDIGIQSHTTQFSDDNRVELSLTTDTSAQCYYQRSPQSKEYDFQITGEQNHTSYTTLDEGTHSIRYYCINEKTSEEGVLFEELTVDTTPPLVEIAMAEQTCSLESIQGTIVASGTGSPIQSISYSITSNATELVSSTTSSGLFREELSLVQGQDYTVSAEVTDKTGNTNTISAQTTATPYDSTTCDTTAPQGTVDISKTYLSNQLTVHCDDDESGCTSFFSSQQTQNNCDKPFELNYYDQQPLNASKTTTFCYEVYDMAGNSADDSLKVTFHKQCRNGIEDPNEEGVDCGGPCVAQCGTCSNGKQDPFEQGVDCGWICSQECQTSEPEPEPECTTDDDCETGDVCSSQGDCIPQPTNDSTQQPTTDYEQDSPLGLLLIIIGVLLFFGGAGYIAYYRYNRYEQQRQQQLHHQQQQLTQSQQEQQRKQQELRQRKLKEIQQKKQAQEKKWSDQVSKRHENRNQLFDEFEQQQTTPRPTKENSSTRNHSLSSKQQRDASKATATTTAKHTSLSNNNAKNKSERLKEKVQHEKKQEAMGEYKNILDLKGEHSKQDVFNDLETVSSSKQETAQTPQKPKDTTPKNSSVDKLSEDIAQPEQHTSFNDLDDLIGSPHDSLVGFLESTPEHLRIKHLEKYFEDKANHSIFNETTASKSLHSLLEHNIITQEQLSELVSTLEKQRLITADQANVLKRAGDNN